MARKRSDAHRRVSLRPWARARWTPGDAQRVLEAWRGSGLELSAWCRREGVEYERVRRWRSRLAVRSRRGSTQTATFLPVRVLESAVSPEGPSFELALARGVCLRVPAQFDEAALSRLLRVVEASA
jgi:hypothetical protein